MATSEDDPVGYDAQPAAPVKDWTKSLWWRAFLFLAGTASAATTAGIATWWAVKVYNFLP